MIIELSNGTTDECDLLVCADGTHSLAREYVTNQKIERRYAGYVNYNGLVEVDENIAPANQWTTFVGEGKRVSLMPVAGHQFYYFFDIPLAKGLEDKKENYRTDLQNYFKNWSHKVQLLIQKLSDDSLNRVEVHDIKPFNTWVKGRVVLLGDAAHSTTPDIGQGGCQAMEDAIYLARSIQINDLSLQYALKKYEEVRSQRANDLVLRARKRCDVTHMKDEKATLAWYEELRQEDGSNIMHGIIKNIEGNVLD